MLLLVLLFFKSCQGYPLPLFQSRGLCLLVFSESGERHSPTGRSLGLTERGTHMSVTAESSLLTLIIPISKYTYFSGALRRHSNSLYFQMSQVSFSQTRRKSGIQMCDAFGLFALCQCLFWPLNQ